MKKFLVALIAMTFLSNVAFADCDFKTGITKNESGSYTYTRECHLKVGEMKQDLEIAQQQNEKYVKALDLKDLALTKADQRADMWMNTSFKLEDRVNTIESMQNTNKWVYFGIGVLSVFVAGYAANQIYHGGR